MLDMAKLKAKLEQKQTTGSFSNSGNHPQIFSFSKLKPGEEIRIRFLEDADIETPNDFFWRERHTRSLVFNSVKLLDGTTLNNKVYVTVPAFNMKKGETSVDNLPQDYLFSSDDDVIQQQIKPWYIPGDEVKQKLYGRYKQKTTYVFQGFVRSPGYENKIYRFIINTELYELIKNPLTRFKESPVGVDNGRDFILVVGEKTINLNGKTTKVKEYMKSYWDEEYTPLNAQEKAFLETNKAFVLKDYIPKKPNAEQLVVMNEMFTASYEDEPYDIARWSKTFRPDNLQIDANGNIRDVRQNNTASATDIPQQPQMTTGYAQPSPMQMGEQVSMAQMHQAYTQPMTQQPVYQQPVQQQAQPNWGSYNQPENRQMLVDTPVAQPTAPTIAAKVTENVQSTSPTDSVSEIMARLTGKM